MQIKIYVEIPEMVHLSVRKTRGTDRRMELEKDASFQVCKLRWKGTKAFSLSWIFHNSIQVLMRVFENMVLRRIFGSRRDEVTGEWRRLHNEELNDL